MGALEITALNKQSPNRDGSKKFDLQEPNHIHISIKKYKSDKIKIIIIIMQNVKN